MEQLEVRELLANSFLQGVVFHDLNENSRLDPNEPRMAGATVRVFRGAEANPFRTLVTGNDGYYRFDDLPPAPNPEFYRIEQTAPAGFTPSGAEALTQINPATIPANTRNRIDVRLVDPAGLDSSVYYPLDTFVVIPVGGVRLFGQVPVGFQSEPGGDVGQLKVNVLRPGLPAIDILTWCAELAVADEFPGGPFTPGPVHTQFPRAGGQIGYLYNRHGARTDLTNVQAAALQMVFWELIYDVDRGNPFDLVAGNFQYVAQETPQHPRAAIVAAATGYFNESVGRDEPALYLRMADPRFQGALALGSFNFGNRRVASLSGHKWHDLNANGAWEGNEPGLTGWTIQVLQNSNVVTTAVTGAGGRYQVDNLVPGTYEIREVLQPNWIQSYPTGAGTHTVTVTAGQNFVSPPFSAVPLNFGNFQQGGASGVVTFRSPDCTEIIERGPQSGVRILLDRQVNGQFQQVAEMTTGANGVFSFQNLNPGTYRVRQVVQGWTQVGGPPASFVVSSGQEVAGLNFRNDFPLDVDARCGAISGRVTFQEPVCEGIQDKGGRQGVTVYIDANRNARLDDGETRTVTDVNGNYRLSPLGRGSYQIRVLVPAGGTAVGPDFVEVVQTTPIFNVTGVNFRLQFPPVVSLACGTISGRVTFREPTCDGLVERGGRQGVTVYLDANRNGRLDDTETRTTTNASGDYRFGPLGSGTYQVRFVTPAGLRNVGQELAETTQTTPVFNVTGLDFKLEVVPNPPLNCIPGPTENGKPLVPIFPGVTPPVLISDLGGKGQLLGSTIGQESQNGGVLSLAAFVTGVYRGLLNRAPDDAGLLLWVRQLQSGAPRAAVVNGIYNSVEHRSIQVDFYYQTYLGRRADAVGKGVWVNALLSGLPEKDFVSRFLGSAEFYARSRSDNGQFISNLYATVLNRPPESFGFTAWVQALQAGASRETVALAFLSSRESSGRVLDQIYSSFLDRRVDPVGEQAWLNAMGRGQVSWSDVTRAVLASDEYFARLAALARNGR